MGLEVQSEQLETDYKTYRELTDTEVYALMSRQDESKGSEAPARGYLH